VTDRLALGLGGGTDVAQGLDHDLRGHGRTLVRDEERRALAEDHRDTRPPVMRSRVAPPRIGGVLQQLDQEPTVVLAPEKALSSSKRTASPDLLSGVMTRARRVDTRYARPAERGCSDTTSATSARTGSTARSPPTLGRVSYVRSQVMMAARMTAPR